MRGESLPIAVDAIWPRTWSPVSSVSVAASKGWVSGLRLVPVPRSGGDHRNRGSAELLLLRRRALAAAHCSRGGTDRGAVSRDGSVAPDPDRGQCFDRTWRIA